MKGRKRMQVVYPVAMTKSVTLYHHLTQLHYQRFYQQTSVRMASIQGLKVNADTEDQIQQIEKIFVASLDKAVENLQVQDREWSTRLEAAGVEPNLERVQGGESFDAPLTTPWGTQLLKIYAACDRLLMLVEFAWIAEEIGDVISKRKASNAARKPLVECCRQIQRAVTQAFQESSRRDRHVASPNAYGDAGKHLYAVAPDVLQTIKTYDTHDVEGFQNMTESVKTRFTDKATLDAIDEVCAVRRALAERRAQADKDAKEAGAGEETGEADERTAEADSSAESKVEAGGAEPEVDAHAEEAAKKTAKKTARKTTRKTSKKGDADAADEPDAETVSDENAADGASVEASADDVIGFQPEMQSDSASDDGGDRAAA